MLDLLISCPFSIQFILKSPLFYLGLQLIGSQLLYFLVLDIILVDVKLSVILLEFDTIFDCLILFRLIFQILKLANLLIYCLSHLWYFGVSHSWLDAHYFVWEIKKIPRLILPFTIVQSWLLRWSLSWRVELKILRRVPTYMVVWYLTKISRELFDLNLG